VGLEFLPLIAIAIAQRKRAIAAAVERRYDRVRV
jgi:hypothetical protein